MPLFLRRDGMRKIKITAGSVEMTATLNDSKTANLLWDTLPATNGARVWGDEIYFPIPMKMQGDNARATVPSGTIAFWPPGSAFCIFFGQTPASPVNVMGKLDGDPKLFKNVRDGETVNLEKASEE